MRSPFARRRGNSEEAGGAGWIYADLFLALMVVGLGSAVITSSSPASGSPAASAMPTYQLSCAEFPVRVPRTISRGGPEIEKAISSEIAKRGWAADAAKPGLIIVVGGFSSPETVGAGDGRARQIIPSLRKSTPLFEKVEMRTAGARAITVNGSQVSVGGAGSYLLVVYLIYSGPQLSEDCTR